MNFIRGLLRRAVARPALGAVAAGAVAVVVTLAGAALQPADADAAAREARAATAAGAALAVGPWGPADELALIPANYLTWYVAAARTCRGLAWEVLAGIGTMESNNGRSNARGVHQGKNRKGAEGPMQFEPATFAEYAVRIDRFQKLTPYNPADASSPPPGCCALTVPRTVRCPGSSGPSSPITTRTGTCRTCWPSRPVTRRPPACIPRRPAGCLGPTGPGRRGEAVRGTVGTGTAGGRCGTGPRVPGAPRADLRTEAGLRGGVGLCGGAGLLRRRVGRVDLGSWMRALLAALGD